MSLIYIGCDDNQSDPSVEALYHNMNVKSPFWPRARFAEGGVRYELFINATNQLETIYIGIPYQKVTNISDMSESFLENFSERLIGGQNEDTFQYDEKEYTLYSISKKQISVSQKSYDGIEFVQLEISDVENSGNFAFSFEATIERMAINVADSLFFETIWSLDVTLYGPVNPREHSFLEVDTLKMDILEVKTGYSYLYLPENSFPKTVTPVPLESFFRESENKFYYTWVVGNLDPWYEQRMMITYGSHQGNYIAAIIASVIASIIFLAITVLPNYISDILEIARQILL